MMEPSIPPRLAEPQPVSRWRWAIHLLLVTGYVAGLMLIGLARHQVSHPAFARTAKGLFLVCAFELLSFALVLGLAWLASRATSDDLLLRWRGKGLPVLLGAGYSIGLRLGLAVVVVATVLFLLLTRMMTLDSIQDLATRHRPGVEKAIDVEALRDNPAYYWLALTVLSFLVGGLREELWRTSFLAGMKKLWPALFGSSRGQVYAAGVAAVIFGLAHLSMGAMAAAMAGLIGLGLGLIMVLHRSIWPAVFAHGFFDCTSMALIPSALDMLRRLPTH